MHSSFNMGRRQWLQRAQAGLVAAGLTGLALPALAQVAACPAADWPLWSDFKQRFIEPGGRVVDFSVPQLHTTSEGQSYAMFFALIADDRVTFDRLWQWSIDNLSGGDLGARLPAWQWGKREDGSWGVIDPNAAADADLWYAYGLIEAARVWNHPPYADQARTLLRMAARDEVADLPGLGLTLLPAPEGFVLPDQVWRLNSSYLPMSLLRRLAAFDKKGPWTAITRSTSRMITESSANGFTADWVAYKSLDGKTGRFVVDPVKGDLGSYDAIRTYMWAGMTPPSDPLARPMLSALQGMLRASQATGLPPEQVQVLTGATRNTGPVGFSAALLPYFEALGETRLRDVQGARVQTAFTPGNPNPPPYYDYVLALFATGWAEQRYRFLASGTAQFRWEKACPRATAR